MPHKKKLARLPRLFDCKGDLTKNWFVEYAYRNPNTLKLERFRISENINDFNTADERIAAANKIITVYSRKLKSGFNPFINDQWVYDSLSYESAMIKKRKVDFTIEGYLNEAYQFIEKSLKDKTQRKYLGQLRQFCFWLSDKKYDNMHIDEFSVNHCTEFLNQFKSPTTRNDYKANMSRFWKLIIQFKKAKENPWDVIKKIPEYREGKLPFNKRQIEILKNEFYSNHPHLWLFCMFQYYCFIRPGELRLLKVEHVDIANQVITIPADISKNKKKQTVWIPDVFLEHVQFLENEHPEFFIFSKSYKPGMVPVSRDFYNKLHKKVLSDFGFGRRYALYSWKHTGAKALATSGANIKELQMQLRHSDLETTDIYLKSLGIIEFSKIKTSFPEI